MTISYSEMRHDRVVLRAGGGEAAMRRPVLRVALRLSVS